MERKGLGNGHRVVTRGAQEARHPEAHSQEEGREQREAGEAQVGSGADVGVGSEVSEADDPL